MTRPKEQPDQSEKVFVHDFFDTAGMADFSFKDVGPPPTGYPRPAPDSYSVRPFAGTYRQRRAALIDHCLKNPAGPNIKGYYYELVRIACDRGPVHESLIEAALAYIDERRDCSDFVMLGIVRLLYQLKGRRLCTERLIDHAERTLLGFKYEPDEPGIDSMCYWTENHYIMFAANQYLAGRLFSDRVFTNSGMTGRQAAARAERRILKWLEMRYQTGFSEWLSHIYYDEDITALANLIDFAGDPVIVRKAEIVLDLLFLDMALNSFRGAFGCSHGRSYGREKRNAAVESTTDTQKLMFGTGVFAGADNMGAVSLALGDNYRLPRAVYEIANDHGRPITVNRQRMGIRIEEAGRWGLSYDDLESGAHFLTLEAYLHPKTVNLVLRMFDAYRWWDNQFFSPFKPYRALIKILRALGLMPVLARLLEKDVCRNTREEVNLYTYKTPDYLISSAQDYRAGYGGDQQHIWQATLSPAAVCFTTHPGHRENTSAGYWVGSGTLPRVAQIENVVVACYNISRMPGLYMTNKLFFTHAWFPRSAFDEVRERAGWIFGRKADGYVALYSKNGYRWQTEGPDAGCEVIAEGTRNVWICEMGNKQKDGSFGRFVEKIAGARVGFRGLSVVYDSPSLGTIRFGWKGALTRNGTRISLRDYPRYDTPYTRTPFPAEEITIACGEHRLRLNLSKNLRDASSLVE
jgi:hypothetical protein